MIQKKRIPWNKWKTHTEATKIKIWKKSKWRTHSILSKEKMSASRKWRIISKETREKQSNSMKGKYHTEATKEKIREKRKEQIFLEETRKKMSIAQKKRIIPTEQRIRMNLSNIWKNIWRIASDITKEKMSKIRLWKKIHTDESKKKIADNNRWRIYSEETKKKLSWANCHFRRWWKSYELYTKKWTKELKNKIRERDFHTCQICGAKKSENNLDVHHIDYDKKNSSSTNLITLCRKCHSKTTNWNRPYREKVCTSKLASYHRASFGII